MFVREFDPFLLLFNNCRAIVVEFEFDQLRIRPNLMRKDFFSYINIIHRFWAVVGRVCSGPRGRGLISCFFKRTCCSKIRS